MDLPYEASAAAVTLFGFGVTFAGSPATTGVAISSFAQSPLDQLFGDARFGVEGRHLLVEFKRGEAVLSTDLAKPRRKALRTLLSCDTQSQARVASRAGHWFGYGAADGVAFTPYVDGLDAANEGRRLRDVDVLTLLAFSARFIAPPEDGERVRGWATAAGLMLPQSVGLSWDEMLQYLELVVLSDSSADSAGVDPPVAGYWIAAHADGGIATTAFTNDAHLAELLALARRTLRHPEQSAIEPKGVLPPAVLPSRPSGPRKPGR